MSTLLTWSSIYSGDFSQAPNSGLNSAIALKSTLDSASANADFPWIVCSSDLTTENIGYITIKRKSGSPGRILVLFGGTYDVWNTTISNSTYHYLASTFSVCYIAGATTDTPANLSSSSDPIFPNQDLSESTPISTAINFLTTNEFFSVLGNEDYLYIFSDSSAGTSTADKVLISGGCLVDKDDNVKNASFASASYGYADVSTGTDGGFLAFDKDSVEKEQWGFAVTYSPKLFEYGGRDNITKKTFFPKLPLGSVTTPNKENFLKYSLRQVSWMVKPITNGEIVSHSNGQIYAFCLMAGSSNYRWWFCNFKLNV